MVKPHEKLAQALRRLKRLQDKHHGVVETKDLEDWQRVQLVETGFLRPVIKGWYICSDPRDKDGDSTRWYASFWSFLSGYLGKRFGKRYCLNPEASLLLQTANTVIPRQVVVVTKDSGSSVLELPFETSVILYQDERRVPRTRTDFRGLQVLPVPEALCRVSPNWFRAYPQDAQVAISLVRHVSELLAVLLAEDGMVAAGSRLAGALRFAGRGDEAEQLIQTMSSAGHKLKEQNPFDIEAPYLSLTRERSPYVLRITSMWQKWRDQVLSTFPAAPGLPDNPVKYLAAVQERYASDAYNSLSIEGYQVTDELIERVAKGGWSPETDPNDQKDRDALAARGYFEAFQATKDSITRIIAGANAGAVGRTDHHRWFAALFSPAVKAGILEAHQLAGYRTGPVFIRNSMHTPLPRDAILDSLEKLFDLLEGEDEACVKAVLGHHLFAFIHPYFDGNGRVSRFLTNSMLASGGYPWTVIRVKRRSEYMAALEQASVHGNIAPFALFIRQEMQEWSPSTSH